MTALRPYAQASRRQTSRSHSARRPPRRERSDVAEHAGSGPAPSGSPSCPRRPRPHKCCSSVTKVTCCRHAAAVPVVGLAASFAADRLPVAGGHGRWRRARRPRAPRRPAVNDRCDNVIGGGLPHRRGNRRGPKRSRLVYKRPSSSPSTPWSTGSCVPRPSTSQGHTSAAIVEIKYVGVIGASLGRRWTCPATGRWDALPTQGARLGSNASACRQNLAELWRCSGPRSAVPRRTPHRPRHGGRSCRTTIDMRRTRRPSGRCQSP